MTAFVDYEVEIENVKGDILANAVRQAAEAMGWEPHYTNVSGNAIRRVGTKPRLAKHEYTKIVMTKDVHDPAGVRVPTEIIKLKINGEHAVDRLMLRVNGEIGRLYDVGAFTERLYEILYGKGNARKAEDETEDWNQHIRHII